MLPDSGPCRRARRRRGGRGTTAAVKTKLLADTKVGGLGIDVDTKDNVVTLTGKVRSARSALRPSVWREPHDRRQDVVNKLVVDPNYRSWHHQQGRQGQAEIKMRRRTPKTRPMGTTGKVVDKTRMPRETVTRPRRWAKNKDVARMSPQDEGRRHQDQGRDGRRVDYGRGEDEAARRYAVRGLKIDVDTKDTSDLRATSAARGEGGSDPPLAKRRRA